VPADEMPVLPQSDRGAVPISRDAQQDELAVREVNAGRDRRHASVHGVERVRAPEEIGRRFAGASDPGELRDPVLLEPRLVRGLDDAVRDGVVAAAWAEGRFRSLVIGGAQADAVHLRSRSDAHDAATLALSRARTPSTIAPAWIGSPS